MKKTFIYITILMSIASLFTWLTQPELKSEKILLKWQTDANPVRLEQVKLFHEWLIKKGVVDKNGECPVEVKLGTANTQSVIIQAVSGVGGDWFDADPMVVQAMGVCIDINKNTEDKLNTYAGLESITSVDGVQYGYPCNVNCTALWVNRDTFKKLGLSPPADFSTPEQFESLGKEFVKRANKEKGKPRVYFCDSLMSGWLADRFQKVYLRSLGLDYFNETMTASHLNDSRYVKLLNRIEKWQNTDRLFPSSADMVSMNSESGVGGESASLFAQGRYGLINTGRWLLIQFRQYKNPINLSLINYPQYEYRNSSLAARCAVVYAGSKNQKYGRLFMQYLASVRTIPQLLGQQMLCHPTLHFQKRL